MKMFFVALLLTMSGCQNRTNIHIYGKYLTELEQTKLVAKLNSDGFRVTVNTLDFPTTIQQQTLIYSLALNDNETIERVLRLLREVGYNVDNIAPMTTGNHWYTGQSIGVFLIPASTSIASVFTEHDLVNRYTSTACDADIMLSLQRNRTYQYTGQDNALLEPEMLSGRWVYRQFPYVELHPTSKGFGTHYFAIITETGQDIVGPISYTKLKPLNHIGLPESCIFVHGVRE